jgi:hypothetical protein
MNWKGEARAEMGVLWLPKIYRSTHSFLALSSLL